MCLTLYRVVGGAQDRRTAAHAYSEPVLSDGRTSFLAIVGGRVWALDAAAGSASALSQPNGTKAWRLFGGAGQAFGVLSGETGQRRPRLHLSARTFADPDVEDAHLVIANGAIVEAGGGPAAMANVSQALGLFWPWVARFDPDGAFVSDISDSLPGHWGDQQGEDPTSFVTSPSGELMVVRRARGGGEFTVLDPSTAETLATFDFLYGTSRFAFPATTTAGLWVADLRCVYRIDLAAAAVARSALIVDTPWRCYVSNLAIDRDATEVAVRVSHRGWQAPALYLRLAADTLRLLGATEADGGPVAFLPHDEAILEAMPEDPPVLRTTQTAGIDPNGRYQINERGWPRCS